jgi:hypothetical protein
MRTLLDKQCAVTVVVSNVLDYRKIAECDVVELLVDKDGVIEPIQARFPVGHDCWAST